MNRLRFCFGLWITILFLVSAARAEMSFEPVAISGDAAPGFTGRSVFSQFSCLALSDDGRVIFTGSATGTGITLANGYGVWEGVLGALNLIARSGNAAPGGTGWSDVQVFQWHQY